MVLSMMMVLDFAMQLLLGGNIFCYPPQVDILDANSHNAYINSFCMQSLSNNEFYTLFLLTEGIVLMAPHYIWMSLFSGQFHFFTTVQKLYHVADTYLIRKLKEEFPDQPKCSGIIHTYRMKLLLQAAVATLVMILDGTVFPLNSFTFVSECPVADFNANNDSNIPEGWLLPFSVQCVYAPFRLLPKIWFANLFLLFGALVLALSGLIWTMIKHAPTSPPAAKNTSSAISSSPADHA